MSKLLDRYDDFAEDHPWLFLLSAAVVGIPVCLVKIRSHEPARFVRQ